MAKLSTPFHPYEQRYAVTQQGTVPHCPSAAYRRDPAGHWLCRKHMRLARERAARLRADGVFRCVKCGHEIPRLAQDPERWSCARCAGDMIAVRESK